MRDSAKPPEDARTRILDAAEELFAREGFDATSTARLATQARVPKGLLFYYFPKKIDVLLTLLAERLPAEPVREPAALSEPGDVARSLVRLADRLDLGNHESVVLRTIVWREAETHPEVAAYLRRLYADLVEATAQVMTAAAGGTVDPSRCTAAATAWVGTMLLAASTSRSGGPAPDLPAVARFLADGLRR
ncbi:MAG TPA: TetR/AcrR family transcriptional regulator [Mycobacteriales bacterium]|nr:TetR/AcrR family transcriptional regulator [Mycobacteriales bacterium]